MSSLKIEQTLIQPGSTVLVTGGNGFIGSHVVDQFIYAGYKVRCSVRDTKKNDWMNEFFENRHGPGKFELVEIKDISKAENFKEAMKGVAGVAHTASHVEFQASEPSPTIPNAIKTVISALEAAAEKPPVKSVVITSSAWTAAAPKANIEYTVDHNTWNEEAVTAAWSKDQKPNSLQIFQAGKTQAEQEAWKWHREHKMLYVLNAVLPDTVFGEVFNSETQGASTTAGWAKVLYDGQNKDYIGFLTTFVEPQQFVDVVDTARLHVAALVNPDFKNERIFGCAETWNWNDVLAVFREAYPNKKFLDDMDLGRDVGKWPTERGREILRTTFRQANWTSLEGSVKINVSSLLK